MERCYGPAVFEEVLRATAHIPIAHCFCGGKPGVAEKLASTVKRKFSNSNVVGTFSPTFRPVTSVKIDDLAGDIDASGAAIVWVGISTPKQERLVTTDKFFGAGYSPLGYENQMFLNCNPFDQPNGLTQRLLYRKVAVATRRHLPQASLPRQHAGSQGAKLGGEFFEVVVQAFPRLLARHTPCVRGLYGLCSNRTARSDVAPSRVRSVRNGDELGG